MSLSSLTMVYIALLAQFIVPPMTVNYSFILLVYC